MATYSKEYLSGTSNGRPVLVNQTVVGSAITVHTPHATAKDEVWLWAENTTASAATLSVLIDDGSVVDPDDYFVKALAIPANSPRVLILDGQPLTVAANVLKAFASVNNAIVLSGFVNRIT